MQQTVLKNFFTGGRQSSLTGTTAIKKEAESPADGLKMRELL
jgi:hypothetical protein